MSTKDPGLPTPDAIDNRPKRVGKAFTLPQKIMELPTWTGSGFTSDDLTFVLVEPSVADEEEARKFAKGDPIKMAERLQDRVTVRIGKTEVRMNHGLLVRWKDAIGLKGRKIVEAKFLEYFQVSDDDMAEVDASGKDVVV